MTKYDVYKDSIIDTTFDNDILKHHDEFAWNVNTNRLLMYFIVDDEPVYDILTQVYGFKVNKLIRMDKGISCRNRCMTAPYGIGKKLFMLDIEFSKYVNKDEIINDVLEILNSKFTKREFDIAKSQKLGSLMHLSCDPVKACIFSSERHAVGITGDIMQDLQDVTYKEASSVKLDDYKYVLGTN